MPVSNKKLKNCAKQLRKIAGTGVIDETQAEEVIADIERRVRAKDSETLGTVGEAVNSAVKDYTVDLEAEIAVQRRNALITLNAVRDAYDRALAGGKDLKQIKRNLKAFMEGSQRKDIPGIQKGIGELIEGWEAGMSGKLLDQLEEANLRDAFLSNDEPFVRDVYNEFYDKPTGNAQAKKLVDIIRNLSKETVGHLNRYGAFIRWRPDHIMHRGYDRRLVIENFGPKGASKTFRTRSQNPAEYEETFKNWSAYMLERINRDETFRGADPDQFLRNVFDNIMEGKQLDFRAATGAEVNQRFKRAGSKAKQVSAQRVLHFKDGDSAFDVYKLMSPVHFSDGIVSEMSNFARNMGLMQSLGPNPEMAMEKLLGMLHTTMRGTPGSGDLLPTESFGKFMTSSYNGLSGKSSIPMNPDIHANFNAIQQLQAMSDLGGMAVFTIPDKVIQQSTLFRNGVGWMNAWGKSIFARKPSDPEAMRVARLHGAMLKGFISSANNRHWGTQLGAGNGRPLIGRVANAARKFFKYTGINWVDDLNGSNVLGVLTRLGGELSGETWEGLGASRSTARYRSMLEAFGFDENRWNAIRSTAYELGEGDGTERFISWDQFKHIPDSLIDPIIEAKGHKPSNFTRGRARAELESDYLAYTTAQKQNSVLEPGARERRQVALGTMPGTVGGGINRMLMQYKSFALAFLNKTVMREVHDFHGAHAISMIGSLTIAGYTVMCLKDWTAGRKRRALFDEEGNPNLGTLSEAFIQGGAAPLIADLILTDFNQQNQTLARTFGGPGLGTLEKGFAFATDAARGEATPAKALKAVKAEIPFQNLIYSKLAFDHLLYYSISEHFDPGSAKRMEETSERFGPEFFIRPSDPLGTKLDALWDDPMGAINP